jgi:hypothetical protein
VAELALTVEELMLDQIEAHSGDGDAPGED